MSNDNKLRVRLSLDSESITVAICHYTAMLKVTASSTGPILSCNPLMYRKSNGSFDASLFKTMNLDEHKNYIYISLDLQAL